MSPDSLVHERLQTRFLVRLWGQRNTLHLYASDAWRPHQERPLS